MSFISDEKSEVIIKTQILSQKIYYENSYNLKDILRVYCVYYLHNVILLYPHRDTFHKEIYHPPGEEFKNLEKMKDWKNSKEK